MKANNSEKRKLMSVKINAKNTTNTKCTKFQSNFAFVRVLNIFTLIRDNQYQGMYW